MALIRSIRTNGTDKGVKHVRDNNVNTFVIYLAGFVIFLYRQAKKNPPKRVDVKRLR